MEAEKTSPTGQLSGLSALYNKLPARVQEAVAYIIFIGGAIVCMDQAAPGVLPPQALKVGLILVALGSALGVISPGSRKVLLFACCLPLLACSTTSAFVVTGDSLHELKNQYVMTSQALREGVDEGKVSREQFAAWVKFSDNFEIFFEKGVEAFLAAQQISDAFSAKRIEEALARICIELLGWYNKTVQLGLLPQGGVR